MFFRVWRLKFGWKEGRELGWGVEGGTDDLTWFGGEKGMRFAWEDCMVLIQ